MSLVPVLIGVAIFVVVMTLVARWMWREGIRQGDVADDPSIGVRLVTGATDGSVTVRVAISNPQGVPVITMVRCREVGGHWPLTRQGRSTLRRSPALDARRDAALQAVDAHQQAVVDVTPVRPRPGRALLVEVYLSQQGQRVRLHRLVCPVPRAEPERPAAGQIA